MEGEYIRPLKEMDEFYELVIIQRDAWGFDNLDVLPPHIFRDVSNLMGPNGIVLGYFIDEKLIGYIVTFQHQTPEKCLSICWLCLQITGTGVSVINYV